MSSGATTTVLKARHLVKRFGTVRAVDDVSFDVEQGEVLTLLGPSGCGKTTTLRLVAGFEVPDEGELELQGRVVVSTSRRVFVPPEKRDLGMVFQSYAVWPHMTVFENVAYPLQLRRVGRDELRKRVEDTLELVGLRELSKRSATMLSGGQQQRVALARALVYSPAILLLDEPLSNLDAKLRGQMRMELKRLQDRLSVTVLFVTHDQLEAMFLSTRLVVMNQGRIEQIGVPSEVYDHPATPFVEDFLGRVMRVSGTVVERYPTGLVVELDGAPGTRLEVAGDDHGGAVGERVVVAIRPEYAEPRWDDDRASPNALRCTVENVVDVGGECELLLRFAEQTHTIPVSRAMLGKIPPAVTVHLPPDRLRVWPRTDARHPAPAVTANDEGSNGAP